MNWIEVAFTISPLLPAREILIAELSELPFESFEETETGLKAYIREADFQTGMLDQLLTMEEESTVITSEVKIIPDQNWNALWESNFEPIEVENFCYIRAPFHEAGKNFQQEIIIEPKMSFGTGHHATTWLMIREMFELDLRNKSLLDMGCGTGVLAILAEKLGAKKVDAIDIDEWAVENSIENLSRNSCAAISVTKGDKNSITGRHDIILANINRNILVADMNTYMAALVSGGHILFSGFYETDIPEILSAVNDHAQLANKRAREGWCMLHFIKV